MSNGEQEACRGPATTDDPVSVIVIEDDVGLAELMRRSLRRERGINSLVATTGTDGIAAATANPRALLLVDFALPDMSAADIIRELATRQAARDFVIVTGQGDERVAVEMMKAGARDYLVKDAVFLDRLSAAVERVLRDIDRDRRLEEAESLLREHERRLGTLMSNLPGMAYRCRNCRDWSMELVSEGCLALTGYSADALVGDKTVSYGSLIHPDDRERVWNTVQDALATEGHFEVEYRIQCADGREKWVCERGIGIGSEGDETPFLEGFIWDVSAKKRSEVQRELMSRALALLNRGNETQRLIGDLLRLIKAETHIEAVGIRLREGDDYPYFETNGLPDHFVQTERFLCTRDANGELILDDDGKPALECMCGEVISGHADPARPFFTDHGSFWTNSTTDLLASMRDEGCRLRTRNRCNAAGYESVALIALKAGNETVGLLQLNDHRRDVFSPDLIRYMEQLSAAIGIALVRQQSAARLREREAFSRSLVDNSPDCIKVLDLEGRLLFMNSGGRVCLEIDDLASYLNRPWCDVWQGQDREAALAAVAEARKGGTGRFAGYSPTATGQPRWWDVIVTPVLDANGSPEKLLAVSRDVTAQHQAEETRKKLEAQLRQAQKLESIGTLAGGVAHEINNPINGIMNYAQLIMDRLEGRDDALQEFASEIISETERIAVIVRNLLGFARRDDNHTVSTARPVDIIKSTLSLMNTVLRHDQITLAVDVAEDIPGIRCHSQQIQQVLMNLVTNARDALNEKYPGYDANKRLGVTASVVERDGNRWLRITVADQGTGVSEHIRQRLFEPFFTTKRPDRGTGLGLSISHGIIKSHGGELHVDSKPGEWTRFHVDLPIENPADAGR